MKRSDAFKAAAKQADDEHAFCAVDLELDANYIQQGLQAAGNAFTFSKTSDETPEMMKAFQSIVAAGIATMRDFGAIGRDGVRAPAWNGKDDEGIRAVLDGERAYQEKNVRGHYETPASRVFSPTEELVMMETYFRKDVKANIGKSDDEALKGVRKVTAMALRGLENFSK